MGNNLIIECKFNMGLENVTQFNCCSKGVNVLITKVPKHKQVDYLVTVDCSPDR